MPAAQHTAHFTYRISFADIDFAKQIKQMDKQKHPVLQWCWMLVEHHEVASAPLRTLISLQLFNTDSTRSCTIDIPAFIPVPSELKLCHVTSPHYHNWPPTTTYPNWFAAIHLTWFEWDENWLLCFDFSRFMSIWMLFMLRLRVVGIVRRVVVATFTDSWWCSQAWLTGGTCAQSCRQKMLGGWQLLRWKSCWHTLRTIADVWWKWFVNILTKFSSWFNPHRRGTAPSGNR